MNCKAHVYRKFVVLVAFSLTIIGAISISQVEAQVGPGTICVLQIAAEGDVFSVIVDQPQSFNVALAVPDDKKVNVPILCDSLGTLALAVSNQKNSNVNVVAQVFNHLGELLCTKGPFLLAENGGRGITFADCP
jgi:hypothetical protein